MGGWFDNVHSAQRDVAREMLPSAFYANSQLLATKAMIAVLRIPMLSRSSLCPSLYSQPGQHMYLNKYLMHRPRLHVVEWTVTGGCTQAPKVLPPQAR